MSLLRLHHAAIICSNYARSKHFYTEILGLKIMAENFRAAKNSYKLDLLLPDGSQIELFSFPNSPQRPSYPEAQGLRHLAFAVEDIVKSMIMIPGSGEYVYDTIIQEKTLLSPYGAVIAKNNIIHSLTLPNKN